MQTHFSERQSFAVQSRSSVFTYGNDEYKRDEIGRQDGLSGTLKPAPKGNLLELHESDCGFESHRICTLPYKNILALRSPSYRSRRGITEKCVSIW